MKGKKEKEKEKGEGNDLILMVALLIIGFKATILPALNS